MAGCFSLLISIIATYVYYSYAITLPEISSDSHCLTSQLELHPIPYVNEADKELLLSEPGTNDVTEQFNLVIRYGFVSNIIIMIWIVFQLVLGQKKLDYAVSSMILTICTKFMWMVQFTMLLVFRFSQPGRICSCDYSRFIALQPDKIIPYQKYYMEDRG